MHVKAVGAGVLVELFAVAVGATLPLPPDVRITAALALLTVGLVGGYVAGRVADGNWRDGIRHGLFAGIVGGFALALVLGYTMATPGSEVGALWGLNYLIATSGIPTDLAAVYDQQLGILFPAIAGLLVAIEGAVAGGAAGSVSVEPP
ncbi:hypothetical protein SAMN05421858_3904 [Haladaptatus litoreus]|uniref:Uncharacterized protein n=1 Tax=Haladaptatus litoreus TaxID=553468 RepID=A0A1N7E0C0_9EURY|nr:hypothetical protein [Haladaptatus litoreus]SIR81519.1 hypothetical protein SAMN05421858_3904 [Haladaptatus litoreus]